MIFGKKCPGGFGQRVMCSLQQEILTLSPLSPFPPLWP